MERADRYLKIASEVEAYARETRDPEVREVYIRIARTWRELADPAQASLAPDQRLRH